MQNLITNTLDEVNYTWQGNARKTVKSGVLTENMLQINSIRKWVTEITAHIWNDSWI